MKEVKERVIAKLNIQDTNKMSHKCRSMIAEWLRDEAYAIVNQGDKYSNNYTARYFVKVQV